MDYVVSYFGFLLYHFVANVKEENVKGKLFRSEILLKFKRTDIFIF